MYPEAARQVRCDAQYELPGVLLTTNLGILNLLPLPALDELTCFSYNEAIRKKRVPPEKEWYILRDSHCLWY